MKRKDSPPAPNLGDVQGEQRKIAGTVKALIRKVVPDSREEIFYGLLNDPRVRVLATQRQLVSVYLPPPVLKSHRSRFPAWTAARVASA